MNKQEVDALIEKYPGCGVQAEGIERHLDPYSSKVLYCLVREYKPQTCIEFGTSEGGSGFVIVNALVANGLPFTYTGFEYDPSYKKLAEKTIIPVSPESVSIYEDVTKNLDKVPKEIDFAFIDPNWDEGICEWWLEHILPRIKKGGLVQIHDWSVTEDYQYQGGNFPGIGHLINEFKAERVPLKKLYSVWDYQEFRDIQIAASFWIKQ